jgi:hypothetical protein
LGLQFEVEQTIHVSKQALFENLLDLEAARQWKQGLVRIDHLDDGQVQPGSEWKEIRQVLGKEATEHYEVLEMDEPGRLVLRSDGTKGTAGKGTNIFTYEITSAGDASSQITVIGELKGITGFAKIMGKPIAGSFKKSIAKDLERLKRYLEV